MGHAHHHDPSLLGKKLWLAIVLNSLVTLAQILVGFLSGSLSLLSDALHNFSDVIALLVSYFAIGLAHKEGTVHKTFGYKRAETLAALINIGTLLIVAALLCKEAVTRFLNPVAVDSMPIMALGALGIIVNLGSALLLKKDSQYSLNVRSAYLHLFSDVLSSVAVVLGGMLIYWTKLYWIDSLLAIAITAYLVYSSWGMLRDIGRIIMHFTPEHIDLKALEKELLSDPNLANVHHIHVWRLNDQEVHFEAHVDFEKDLPLSEVSQTIHKLSRQLRDKFGIRHTVIQPEIGIDDSKKLIVTECHH